MQFKIDDLQDQLDEKTSGINQMTQDLENTQKQLETSM